MRIVVVVVIVIEFRTTTLSTNEGGGKLHWDRNQYSILFDSIRLLSFIQFLNFCAVLQCHGNACIVVVSIKRISEKLLFNKLCAIIFDFANHFTTLFFLFGLASMVCLIDQFKHTIQITDIMLLTFNLTFLSNRNERQ